MFRVFRCVSCEGVEVNCESRFRFVELVSFDLIVMISSLEDDENARTQGPGFEPFSVPPMLTLSYFPWSLQPTPVSRTRRV